MKLLFITILLFLSPPILAGSDHPDLSEFSSLLNADVYAGFGLARDIISHVYKDSPFLPRDYDLAIVGSDLSEEKALAVLSEHGSVVKTIQMYREEIKPSGRIFAYHYGFVIIIDAQGTQIDFKFFKSVEDAHTRGLFDVEKVLIPLNNRSLVHIISDLKDFKTIGKPFEISDPHNGFSSILSKNPKTVNWAKARASSLDWIIRGAMINAKLGESGFNSAERELMIAQLKKVQYIRANELALIKRAMAHKKSWRVKELLADLGFFEELKKWRWNAPALELVDSWNLRSNHFSCGNLL
jgi:hypothetical protein